MWSGIRWTAARRMRVTSLSRMIAPSILASSRSPVAVNGTSSVKPPVEIDSTTLSWPSTIRAPVRPRRIRSRPSRSGGAGRDRGQRRAQPQRFVRALGCHGSSSSCGGRPRPARQSRGRGSGGVTERRRPARSSARRGRASASARRGRRATSMTRSPSTVRARAAGCGPRRLGRDHGDAGSRAGPPRPAAAAGRGPGAARRPARSRRSRPCPAGRRRRGGRGERERDRQVAGRLGEPRAADGGDEDVVAVQPDAGSAAGAPPAPSPPARSRARTSYAAGARRRWASPAPAPRRAAAGGPPCVTVTQVPGTGCVVVLDEQPGRVGDRDDAVVGRGRSSRPRRPGRSGSSSRGPSGTASCGRPRSAAPRRRGAPARAGPAIEPSLVTWPTSTVVMLRVLATRISAAATSLTWVTPPGTPSMLGGADGLHGVDDQQRRADLLDVAEHRAEVGLGGEVELVVDAAGAVGAQPHLGGRLLAGDVERAALVAGGLRGDLEQQRGLADAGLAGEQDRRAGHQAAAEHPVELGHAAGAERGLLDRHLADRDRRRGDRAGLRRAAGRPRRPRRPCPTPGTRRSGRPTCRSPSRTRRSGSAGRRGAFAMGRTLGDGTDTIRDPRRAQSMCHVERLDRSRRGSTQRDAAWPTPPWARRAADPRRRRRAWPASRARPSPTRSTTPTCCAPTPSTGCRRRSPSSATRPTGPPATCAPAPRT